MFDLTKINQQPWEYRCYAEKDCAGCNRRMVCDSSRLGQEDGNTIYVQGPCCCATFFCPNCEQEGKSAEWEKQRLELVPVHSEIIEADFYLNRQDPFEPTGVCWVKNGHHGDLADLLEAEFGLVPDCDNQVKKRLRIIIQEV